ACELPLASGEDAAAAVDRATAAQRGWAGASLAERVALVHRFARALQARREEIARDITRQMGKPIAQARAEVTTCASRASHMAGIAEETLADERLPGKPGFERFIAREPVGVVLNIAPFNYPLLTAVNVVAPAVLAGNAVVLKHASRTPLCAGHFARAFHEAGAPGGLVEALVASHEVVREVLSRREVALVALTGSGAAGREIHLAAAQRLMPAILELGGKDPAYLAEDVDLDFAVREVIEGAFYNAGQSCCGVKRIYAHERIHDSFLEAALAAAAAFVPGDPSAEATTLGPLATPNAPEALEQQLREARSRGARVLCGGERARVGGKGRFFLPTLVEDVPPGTALANEEVFGPVALVERVACDEEALARMNASRFGLSASIWTRSIDRALRMGRRLEAGTVYMNRCDYLDPALPWIGWKQSGLGLSLSRHGLLAMTRPKSFHLRTAELVSPGPSGQPVGDGP
ncbi:MAG TPA: aldehyde dehydrogenase family protein, partial [Anaeromyxobacteraceae bacterium]|nr:aldehyde dehydrogenase family protein [Anaeromyxobacteraceae bacterium]